MHSVYNSTAAIKVYSLHLLLSKQLLLGKCTLRPSTASKIPRYATLPRAVIAINKTLGWIWSADRWGATPLTELVQASNTHQLVTTISQHLNFCQQGHYCNPVKSSTHTQSFNGLGKPVPEGQTLAPCSRQITMPASHQSSLLQARCSSCLLNQQHQSTEGRLWR